MAPAQEIFHSADPGQPAGQVVLAGQLQPGRVEALAELKIAATQGGTLHLGAADGPVLQLDEIDFANSDDPIVRDVDALHVHLKLVLDKLPVGAAGKLMADRFGLH